MGANRVDLVTMDVASTALLGRDPKFRPLSTLANQPNVHYLLADSPLIDAGDAGTGVVSATDQLGRARLNGPLDIGAVEYIAGDETLDLSTGEQPPQDTASNVEFSFASSVGSSTPLGLSGLLTRLLFRRKRQ